VKGLDAGKKTTTDLAEYIKKNTDPNIFPDIRVHDVRDMKIISVMVKESHDKPVFFRSRAYKRVGDTSQKINSSEMRTLAKESAPKVYWDGQVCEGATLADIDKETLDKFRKQYENVNKSAIKSSDKDLLKVLGCIKDVNGTIKITNAGILLFGKEPKKFFLMDYVTVARYPGKDKAQTYLDIKDFYGNLFDIIDSVNEYMTQHIQEVSQVIEGQIQRRAIPQYPYYAIREIITNAVAHRDYSNIGSRIIIRMFKDRIEFNSPGPLPANVTPENIVSEQYSRNPVIADVFNKILLIEKLGEGWDKIICAVKEDPYMSKMPEIMDTGNTVIVTLFASDLEEFARIGESSVKSSVKIIDLIRQNPQISIPEIADALHLTTRAVEKNIAKLKQRCILKRVGPAKGGHWEV